MRVETVRRGVTAGLEDLRGALSSLDVDALDDSERLALLRATEDLTRMLAAVGARTQVAFAQSQVAGQAARGVPVRHRGLAVADDLAAARRTSPSMGSRELSSAKALVAEMPRTLQALAEGTINAYQSRIITEATTCLDPADRAQVDERLAAALPGASNAEIGSAVRALVYELDPAGFVARARQAAKDRGVSVRPAPDVMAVLSARLPAPQAVACYKGLRDHAVAARASGDPRTLNQLMADELVARLTGRTVVDGLDVEVGLVMTDSALFDGASDPADLEGYGPIPAEMARDLLRHARDGSPGGDTAGGPTEEDGSDDAPDPALDEDSSRRTDDCSAPGRNGAGPADPSAGDGTGAPPEACPDGVRCASWDCTLLHGVTPMGSAAATDARTADTPANPAGATGAPTGEPSVPVAPGTPSADPSASTDGRDHALEAAKVWLRRLYADPSTGILTARDPRRRTFTGSLRAFLVARDRTCRNSWCGAPIRDIDHVRRHRDGGTTEAHNARGLCQRCNLARERERHHEPPPDSYRAPPPAATTLLGRPLPRAPAPKEGQEPLPGREVA